MGVARDIRDSLKSIIEAELPDYKEAKNVLDVERNPNVNLAKRYGVRSLGRSRNDDSITKHLTYDHDFEVLIIDLYKNLKKDDQKQQEIAMQQIDAMEALAKRIESKKVGLPGTVLNTEFFTEDEPEFFEDQNLSVLRATFTIKYRIPI